MSFDRLRLRLALALVGLIRFVVPRRQRAAWLAEWRAELMYLSSSEARAGDTRDTDVLSHSLHAIPHAAAHRKHQWSPDMLLQDLRYAVRRLIKAPGFTVVAMLTIAIGVGAVTAIFSVVDSTLLHPLPYADADRLVYLWKQAPNMQLMTTPEAEDVERWRQASAFEEIQVYGSEQLNLTGGDEPRQLVGMRILPGMVRFLGAMPAIGREFTEEEARSDARVVLLSNTLWQSHFGGAADVIGRTLTLNDEPYTVIGVMPADFHFQAPFDDVPVWLPLSLQAAEELPSPFAIGRLREGVSVEAADEELAAIAANVTEETGEEAWPGRARRPQDLLGSTFRTSLVMLQAAVAIVLLIACANVANLLLARGAGQGTEMAVRAAIGAARGRLFRQLLTEHLVLALSGGLLGYGLARVAVAAIIRLRPEDMYGLVSARVDGWIFFFTMGVAALTGVLFGIVPALQASRPQIAAQLGQDARGGSSSQRRSWLRNGLVATEVALALLLLVGAGLLLGSLVNLIDADLGFDTENVLTMTVSLPSDRYPDEVQRREFHRELESRIRQVAGGRLLGLSFSSSPLPTLGVWFDSFAAEGEEVTDAFRDAAAHAGSVEPGFLTTLRVPFVDGRDFTADDIDSPDEPAIINATWARRMWGDEHVAGKRFWTETRNEEGETVPLYHTVVGVIEDAMLVGPTGSLGDLQVFIPSDTSSSLALVIRTAGDPLPLAPLLKEQIWAMDPDLPVRDVALLDDVYAGKLSMQRFNVTLLSAFAGVAVVLALIGVYGVLSYTVGGRTREIGIRVALGARGADVVPMIAWQGMRPVLLGVVSGIGAAIGLTRFIGSLLYEVSAVDPLIYLAVSAAVLVVAALACLLPALRAARLDAMQALRQG
ncbi:MAG: ABC transporter permease [Acidobacteriota bacterium]